MIVHSVSYDSVAQDYYDSILHPTCANFREISRRFFAQLRTSAGFEQKLINGELLETGAGLSLICEELSNERQEFINLSLQDSSDLMLAHSLKWQNKVKNSFISDARDLPCDDRNYDIIFSFLADPYNDENLWTEIYRSLDFGGYWVLTSPAFEWAARFRQSDEMNFSQFQTKDGQFVDLPSLIYPVTDMIMNAQKSGLIVRHYQSFGIDALKGPVSKKLINQNGGGRVLDCYLFEKDFG